MPAAFFVVRATVSDPARRKAFDAWYQNQHLPDAAKSFGVKRVFNGKPASQLHTGTGCPAEVIVSRLMSRRTGA